MTEKTEARLKKTFKNVDTLIIDEFGMLGQTKLYQINENMKRAITKDDMVDFGGKTVIMIGDHN